MVFVFDGFFKTYQYIRVKLFEKLHTLGMRYFDQTPRVRRCLVLQMTQKHCLNSGMYSNGDYRNFCRNLVIFAMFQLSPEISFYCLIFLPILLVVIWYYQNLVQNYIAVCGKN